MELRDILTRVGNGEFLDTESFQSKFMVEVSFLFNKIPMTVSADNSTLLTIQIDGTDRAASFRADFNLKTNMPRILWEGPIPDDIDLQVAVDVLVGLWFEATKAGLNLLPYLQQQLQPKKPTKPN